jgi:hypothetical protein
LCSGVRKGQFHDFLRTALTKWLAGGMRECDVMILVGHSRFATTHQFYLAVADDLVDLARAVSEKTENTDLLCTPRWPIERKKADKDKSLSAIRLAKLGRVGFEPT